MELKAGMWIAQGSETNILILLSGKAPVLKVRGAIDLNTFNSTGKAKELTENSVEVQDILMYPEKYVFLEPSISEAINNEGFNQTPESVQELTDKDKILEEGMKYYKSAICLCKNLDEAKVQTRLFLFRTFKDLKFGQACCMLNLICKKCNQPI